MAMTRGAARFLGSVACQEHAPKVEEARTLPYRPCQCRRLNPFCGGANKSADSETTLRSMWSSVAAIHIDPAYFAILILVVVVALQIWRRRSRRGGGRGPFGRR